jgi:inosine-uridine nucleoside N-ribohydrolase
VASSPFSDDSVAIMMAFQAPGVEVLGLTTIFGNCTTAYATRNALILASATGNTRFVHSSSVFTDDSADKIVANALAV